MSYNNGLTFNELRRVNLLRQRDVFEHCENWTASDWVTAVIGELGELANLIKKKNRGEIVSMEKLGDEIADTIIYLDLLAHHLGFDRVEDIIQRKFNKVSERKASTVTIRL